jgi:conjugative transfer signal peptidase TraF
MRASTDGHPSPDASCGAGRARGALPQGDGAVTEVRPLMARNLGTAPRGDRAESRRVAQKLWPLVVGLTSIAGAAAGLSLGVGLNVSRSAPRGIYRTVGEAPARGALVVACLPTAVGVFGRARGYLGPGTCPGGAQPVLKLIGAVAGDRVELGGDGVTVSGVRLLARPIEAQDSAGRPLPHAAFGSRVAAPGEVWLFGSSPGPSWDSRYFGPVPVTSVRGVVRPVLAVD